MWGGGGEGVSTVNSPLSTHVSTIVQFPSNALIDFFTKGGGHETGQASDLHVHARGQCHFLHDKQSCKVCTTCMQA